MLHAKSIQLGKEGVRPSDYPSGCEHTVRELTLCNSAESPNGKPPSRNPSPCQHIRMSLCGGLEENPKGKGQ